MGWDGRGGEVGRRTPVICRRFEGSSSSDVEQGPPEALTFARLTDAVFGGADLERVYEAPFRSSNTRFQVFRIRIRVRRGEGGDVTLPIE